MSYNLLTTFVFKLEDRIGFGFFFSVICSALYDDQLFKWALTATFPKKSIAGLEHSNGVLPPELNPHLRGILPRAVLFLDTIAKLSLLCLLTSAGSECSFSSVSFPSEIMLQLVSYLKLFLFPFTSSFHLAVKSDVYVLPVLFVTWCPWPAFLNEIVILAGWWWWWWKTDFYSSLK